MRLTITTLIVASIAIVAGCKSVSNKSSLEEVNYAQELPPGKLALRKLSPGEYPDFTSAFSASNVADLTKAIDNSLKYLQAPSSEQAFPYLDITHDRAVATLKELKQI